MLRMSKLADYGTIVMAYMARDPVKVCSAVEIATNIGLELPTVSKILKRLARNELVVSRRGPGGGYMLTRLPREISVADIIEAIEGQPMGLTECGSVPGLCIRESSCSVRANWQRINHVIRAILGRVTLAELAHPLPLDVDVKAIHHEITESSEATSM